MRKKQIQIKFRVTEEEAERIKKKVEKSGMSQQEFLVKTALGKKIVNLEPIRELLPQLGKVGSNLNQIARRLNERQYVDYNGELSEALKGCDDVWQLLRQYLQEQR